MKALLHPTYFGNIAQYVVLAQAESVTFEMCDNYQKQSFRNRTEILGANGKLALSVPVLFSQKNRQLYKEVTIQNIDKWQLNHFKSLESAYRTSPFYEYYIDEIKHLFETEYQTILDFNLACFKEIAECLQIDTPILYSEDFQKEPETLKDYRNLTQARKQTPYETTPYTQVFSNKHGYTNNLSILDLLFNEGTNALSYLESQKLP